MINNEPAPPRTREWLDNGRQRMLEGKPIEFDGKNWVQYYDDGSPFRLHNSHAMYIEEWRAEGMAEWAIHQELHQI